MGAADLRAAETDRGSEKSSLIDKSWGRGIFDVTVVRKMAVFVVIAGYYGFGID
jgi:hypothetical protein